jgi:adenosylhomocysteine nucleosidase
MPCAGPPSGFKRMAMSVDIAIIAALEREVRPLVRRWRRRQLVLGEATIPAFASNGVLVVCSGIGAPLARQAAVAVFASERPRIIISAGLAGALDPKLKVGQIFHPATVVDLGTGARFYAGGSDGVLVSASSVLDRDAKRRISGAFGGHAVDMEAAAVALVAGQHDCPFIALKAVSEQKDFPMPSFDRFIDSRGRIRTARLVAAYALRPGSWPMLGRLARNTARASRELCRALSHLIEQQGAAPEPALSGRTS